MTERCGGDDTFNRLSEKAIRPEDTKNKDIEINGNEKVESAAAAAEDDRKVEEEDEALECQECEGERFAKKM